MRIAHDATKTVVTLITTVFDRPLLLAFSCSSPQVVLFAVVTWSLHTPLRHVLAPASQLGESTITTQLPEFAFKLRLCTRGTCVGCKSNAGKHQFDRFAPLCTYNGFDWLSQCIIRHTVGIPYPQWGIQELTYDLCHLSDPAEPLSHIIATWLVIVRI